MNEFPVSNLEKRLFAGIVYSASAMALCFCVPFLALVIVRDPQWNIGPGIGPGLGFGLMIIAGTLFCGAVGLIAGLVRPGMHAIAVTVGSLFLVDFGLMSVSVRVYSISAAIKAICIILFVWRRKKSA